MDTNKTISEPKTLQSAILHFSDPQRALEYMIPLVWPNGITCPHCEAKGEHAFIATRRIWRCAACKEQFSIKVGTVMEDSPLGLDKWLTAAWLIANAKNGISSCEIHRALGIGQKAAWFLLHRLRYAMKTGSFKKMSGTVEADEAFVGGVIGNMNKSKRKAIREASKKPGKPIRFGGTVGKAIIMGMLERGKNGDASQVRTEMIETARRPHITDSVKRNIQLGSFLMTDAAAAYRMMGEQGFIHMAVNHAITYAKGHIHTNGLENFWSLMQRMLMGTYVACEPFHLEAYLDEQAFRFNLRKRTDGERMKQVMAGVGGKRLTYAQLTGKIEGEQRSQLLS